MNRLVTCTKDALENKRKLFCAYITLGFPSLKFTEELIPALEMSGVDILELGIPFSDPLADGPVIQDAAYNSLCNGTKINDAFEMVSRLRKKGVVIPVVLFSYYNPILSVGEKAIASKLAKSGFDAVLCPDLPPEHAVTFEGHVREHALSFVYLIAPTSSSKRRNMIVKQSDGFIYYVARKGVTGTGDALASDLKKNVLDIKERTDKAVLVGFGVSSPEHVRYISQFGDGVIVGSAIVKKIKETNSVEKTAAYVKKLVKALR